MVIARSQYPCWSPPLSYISKYYGYSCHTPGPYALMAAYFLGAPVIEKHFTLDHNQSDHIDHKHSLNPTELKDIIKQLQYYEERKI